MAQTFKGKPGDLIEIFRGPYKHWAVYIGGQEVVHFTTDGGQSTGWSANPGSSNGKVKREKFTDVVGNHRYQVNNLLHSRRKARDPSIIVKEACAMVGRELQYDAVTYNAEHFATEMRYGKFNGKPGDLIEIFRGLYQQWAVYIGENEVVHFTTDGGQSSGWSANPGSSNGKVKREKFTEVVGSDRYQVNNLLDDRRKARDPSIIVKEACEMVGSELQYDAVTYNAEHFATEMRYGKFNGKPGDLIEIFPGLYQQWAVYIGENEVVHFTTDGVQSSGWMASLSSSSSSHGEVKREKFTEVVGSDRYQVNNLLDNRHTARDPSIIVKEACEMVGRKLPYNLATYNCEHFATEMRYGKAGSLQVKAVAAGVANVAGVAGVAGALVAGPPGAAVGAAAAAAVVGTVAACKALISSRSSS